jgi:dolichol-phosphate mannosyltransferase
MRTKTYNSKFKVSVIFPSYNESDNIIEAIRRVSRSLGNDLYEIIVVDDNSPDETWKIVENIKNPKYKVIRRMKERGLASALTRGIENAKGNIIVWMDCDLGLPPEDVPRLVQKLKDYDVAIGSRYVKGGEDTRPVFRVFASILINLFASLVLGFKVRDYTSGFVAVRKEVLNKVKFSKKGFGEYFIEFAYKCVKNNFKVIEVGYRYTSRKGGISKSDGNLFTLLKYGMQYGAKIIKTRFSIR